MPPATITALVERHGVALLPSDDIEPFCQANHHALLFLPGDPTKFPEAADVAVVLPELIHSLQGRFAAALVAPQAEQAVHARFGCRGWPALVLLRDGAYVGSIERMRSWDDYLSKLQRLLEAPPAPIPGIGVPVQVTNQAPEGDR